MIKDYKDIQVTPELIRKAGECTTAEQLVALGKENGIEISADDAEEVMESLNRPLTDDEIEVVAGGGNKCPIKLCQTKNRKLVGP